ncbi:MAG: hypothetical protein ACI9XR_002009 [Flavobacterium sp.]|jgi:hypothetical protein
MRIFSLIFLFCSFLSATAQQIKQGQVLDFDTTVPIAFAKVSYNGVNFETNWEGKFTIKEQKNNLPITVVYKGYYNKTYYLPKKAEYFIIKMVVDRSQEKEEIYSDFLVNDYVKKIAENKPTNQPEQVLNSFEYKNYEYLLVSADTDSISSQIDTIIEKRAFKKDRILLDSTNYKFKKLLENNHLYQTEKVNLIQFDGKNTKETIIAARMAGFKKPLYEYLGLNLVSYSVYENKLDILEIPVQNPISSYGRNLFSFKLIDSVQEQGRKVYRIYFQPKRLNSDRLRGLLYVDAENFGIAKAYYRIYGIVNVNATFTFNYLKDHKIWFPKKRKFEVVKGNNSDDIKILGGTIKFKSSFDSKKEDISDQVYLRLESTPYDIKLNSEVVIDKPAIKIDARQVVNAKPESFWKTVEKDSLDRRKLKTYSKLDSISVAEKIERKIFLGKKIYNGYFPVGSIDFDLRSLIKYNNYEGFRFGIGGVTNDKFSDKYRVDAYVAYGLKDEKFKFGFTPGYLLDKETETWVNASYTDDLNEIGQISFATEPRRFKIYDPRPINISTFYSNKMASAFIESKYIAKTDTYFEISRSEVVPLFDFGYLKDGQLFTNYNITQVKFAIQWNPFSNYMQTTTGRIEKDKRFPKFGLQLTQTLPEFTGNDFIFSKVDFKINHEIKYLTGQNTSFLLQAGIANGDIPLTHLYSIAPNNLNRETLLKRITFSSKNGFETMFFNEFFSSKYASLQVRHTFNKIRLAYNVKPVIAVVTRVAFGSMDNSEKQVGFAYKTLEKGFFESGVELSQIYKGFGLVGFVRYGPNSFETFIDNFAIKLSYVLNLGL